MTRSLTLQVQHRLVSEQEFLRCQVAEPFSGPVVDLFRDRIALVLREMTHAGELGDVLADQAVGVFVGAALPGAVGRCEVEGDARFELDEFVVVEFRAVVGGDGCKKPREPSHELEGSGIGLLLGSWHELADEQVAGTALDEADDTVLGVLTDDRVDLPVVRFQAPFDGRWALADVAFSGEAAAGIGAAVEFSALLVGAAQMRFRRARRQNRTLVRRFLRAGRMPGVFLQAR